MINDEENNETNKEEHSDYMPKEENKETPPTPEENPVENIEPIETTLPVQEATSTTSGQYGFERQNTELLWVAKKVNDVRTELGKYVIGQVEMVDLLMTGIFANGHILLEGAPGVAKTLSAKVLSGALNIGFSRIQFTCLLYTSDAADE